MAAPRRTSACTGTRSNAASTRRTSTGASCRRPGRITSYREPAGPGVRVDSGVDDGQRDQRPLRPDDREALRARTCDREHARRRMLRALEEFEIGGVTTLIGFHLALLEHPCFAEGATCHGIVESEALAQRAQELSESLSHRTTT